MDFNILAPPLRDFLCLACRAHRLACQFPDFLLCAEESLSRGVRLIRSLVQFIYTPTRCEPMQNTYKFPRLLFYLM